MNFKNAARSKSYMVRRRARRFLQEDLLKYLNRRSIFSKYLEKFRTLFREFWEEVKWSK